MPFTSLRPAVGRLDATQLDLGCGMRWEQVYKVRPRPSLTCPECGWGVHAKRSPSGVPFFCHDPGRPPSCELSNESWEHHMTKLELAGAIRAAGWYAQLEVPAENGSWRADVMASSPDGTQRMAWEAQLSPITVEEIQARTARYRAEEIRVCWVSPLKQPPKWIDAVPAVRIRPPEEDGPWRVDDGLAGFDASAGRWLFREEELTQFVRWALHEQLITCRALPHYRSVSRTVDGEVHTFRRELWWTSRPSARAQSEHDAIRRRRQKEQAARVAQLKEEEARAARRQREREEAERLRRAEAARRRRAEWEEANRVRVEKMRKERVEADARRARERAAREEKERRLRERAEKVATAWWARLSEGQVHDLLAAVADWAWREDQLRIEIPEKLQPAAHFAYGLALYSTGRIQGLYGIVRPCPVLLRLSPQTSYHRIFVRNAREAKQLGDLPSGQLIQLDLPGHEQLPMY